VIGNLMSFLFDYLKKKVMTKLKAGEISHKSAKPIKQKLISTISNPISTEKIPLQKIKKFKTLQRL
jgi:hypothetical protein